VNVESKGTIVSVYMSFWGEEVDRVKKSPESVPEKVSEKVPVPTTTVISPEIG
jgi:hypothetical protein